MAWLPASTAGDVQGTIVGWASRNCQVHGGTANLAPSRNPSPCSPSFMNRVAFPVALWLACSLPCSPLRAQQLTDDPYAPRNSVAYSRSDFMRRLVILNVQRDTARTNASSLPVG